jgi:DNA-binding transcriptional ArsR family regulator
VATYETVLDALGDPTRRAIIDQLRRGPSSVAGLTEYVPVSRPAISQHLKVLGQAGLVAHEPQGTRNIYRVDREGLESLRGWLDQFWTDALDAFAELVRRTEADRPTEIEPAVIGPTEVTPAEVTPAEIGPTQVGGPTEVAPTEIAPTEIAPTQVGSTEGEAP